MIKSDVLNRLDLNLLKTFRAIYETGQTTAAAARLGLSQPAVSQALRRLRGITGDPLFVVTRAGMEPTARAHELSGPVHRALDEIAGALERAPAFDPANARRRFRLGMLDYGVIAIAPVIAKEISARAPGISVEFMHVPASAAPDMLLEDQLDLATGPFENRQNYFIRTPLFCDDFVAISRTGHPAIRRRLDVNTFAALGHVDVSYAAGENDLVERILSRHGLARVRSMTTTHFTGAFHAVGGSDLIAVAPRLLAKAHQHLCGLSLHELPFEIPPLAISAMHHRRHEADAGLVWLLQILKRASGATLAAKQTQTQSRRQT